MTNMNLKVSLFAIRLSLVFFFAIWAIEKFIKPETTVAIWKAFYLVENLPLEASYAIGAVQSIAVLCLLFGIVKFWSYGFFLVIHGIGTLLTYERLLDPYTGSNHLFAAAVPVCGALLALFLLRQEDTLFTLGKSKSAS
ncbi:MAG: hypothetical protein MRY72_11245 [Aquisalinus sp.]|nr:hypothetical protein [Aquisalinus sp.]